MRKRLVCLAAMIGCLPALAGEIIILQPGETATTPRSGREPSRSERELGRTMEDARQHAGRSSGSTVVIIDSGKPTRGIDRAEQSMREAQDYLRPGGGGASTMNAGDTAVIINSAPASDAERMRSKARSYIAPEGGRGVTKCGEVTNQVGMIGDGGPTGRNTSVSANEKGNMAVIVNCK